MNKLFVSITDIPLLINNIYTCDFFFNNFLKFQRLLRRTKNKNRSLANLIKDKEYFSSHLTIHTILQPLQFSELNVCLSCSYYKTLLFLGSINIGKDANGTACHLPDDSSSVFSCLIHWV